MPNNEGWDGKEYKWLTNDRINYCFALITMAGFLYYWLIVLQVTYMCVFITPEGTILIHKSYQVALPWIYLIMRYRSPIDDPFTGSIYMLMQDPVDILFFFTARFLLFIPLTPVIGYLGGYLGYAFYRLFFPDHRLDRSSWMRRWRRTYPQAPKRLLSLRRDLKAWADVKEKEGVLPPHPITLSVIVLTIWAVISWNPVIWLLLLMIFFTLGLTMNSPNQKRKTDEEQITAH